MSGLPLPLPAKLRTLTEDLLSHRWAYMVQHGTDTGSHPFISVEAVRGDQKLKVTWHTRPTEGKTYRLFTCMVFAPYCGWYDVTLARVMDEVKSHAD